MTSALILAAGLGSRLMPLTADRPKALIEVNGQPMLGALIATCINAGLQKVIVVTGCKAEQIDSYIASHYPSGPNGDVVVQTVYNEAYERLGNAWSVAMARTALGGETFIKLDGDLVIDASILRQLANSTGSSLALDSQSGVDAEAMKATVAGGLVTGLGKWIELNDAAGESIGIEKITATDADRVFDALEAIARESPNAYYEDAYHQLVVADELALTAVDIGLQKWAEIDCLADLREAEKKFPQTENDGADT